MVNQLLYNLQIITVMGKSFLLEHGTVIDDLPINW